jgi:major membrane immunogen (membrane-anchored lipoprotein)
MDPTQVTQYQTGFAKEVAPYAQNTLGAAYATAFQPALDASGNPIMENGVPKIGGLQPFQTYNTQDRFEKFNRLQQKSFEGADTMQPSQYTEGGAKLAGLAGLGALGTNYQGGQFGNQFQAPQNLGYNAQTFQANQMGPTQQVGTQDFRGDGTAQSFMNPYMQNVVDIQKREAQRQSGIQGTQQQAQAAQAGAFGGGRDAIMRAERERNLGQQMGDIQAQGSNAAFQQAQQQFNAQNQLGLQAQMANQGAGLTVGGQNLNALQQTNLANQAAQNQAGQFGAGQGLQAAGLGAQYGIAGQQLGEQSRQYGAGLGLQGLQTAIQGAGQVGALGQQGFQQGMDINKLQNQYGGQQQQQAQNMLNADYQQFLDKQNYPYKQLGFMSDMIRGLPVSNTGSTMYQQPPSTLGQLSGLALGASQLVKKDGGQIHAYAEGGITGNELPITNPDDSKLASMMDGMSIQQLQQIAKLSPIPQARRIAQQELQDRASMRTGGIVAFKEGGDEGEEATSTAGDIARYVSKNVSDKWNALSEMREQNRKRLEATPGLFEALTPSQREEKKGIRAAAGKKYDESYEKNFHPFKSSESSTQLPSTGTGAGRGVVNPNTRSVSEPSRDEDTGKGKSSKIEANKIVKATADIAESHGMSKDDYMSNVKEMMDYLGQGSDKAIKGLKDLITQDAGKAEAVRSDAQRKALRDYGFNMAAAASKVGTGGGFAGLLRSASEAAPSISESMNASEKVAMEMEHNQRQMQIEMAKYEVSMRKGDERTALGHASNIRQLQQQQAQLQETSRHNKASEGLMGQRIAAASTAQAGRGQEKTFAPILRGIGAANSQANKIATDLIKSRPDLVKPGEDPAAAFERIRNPIAAKLRKEAVPMFGPTGKMYGAADTGEDDDMEG